MCEGVQSAGQSCIIIIIINTRSTFGPRGSGRLRGPPGDKVPAHNFTCQSYAASRRKNQSAACHLPVLDKTETLTFVFLAFRDIIF